MCAEGQTDMTNLIVPFRNFTHLTRNHFLSIFSQKQKVSITQVLNFVETRPSTVAKKGINCSQYILQMHIFLVLYYYYYYICFHFSASYLQLYTRNNTWLYFTQCWSCCVFTVCATCNVISPVQYVLYLHISTFHSLCAVPNMAGFCNSLISYFPAMLFRYCLHLFETVPVAPVITGITFVFTFHNAWISIVSYSYFKMFSACFLITFLSAGIAISIDIHVPLLL